MKRAWRVDTVQLLPEVIEKAFLLAESANLARCWSTCPWTSSRNCSIRRCSPGSTTTPRRCAGRRSTTRPPEPSSPTGRGRAAGPVRRRRRPAGPGQPRAGPLRGPHGDPGGPQPDGQGRSCRRPPAGAGDDRLLGHPLVNDACLAADVILAIGTRFKEADSSSWYRGVTFNIPDTALVHVDIEPRGDRPHLPPEIGVVADARGAGGAEPGGPRALPRRVRAARRPSSASPRSAPSSPPATGHGHQRRLPDDARADPGRGPRRAARRRLHHDRRRLEQERRGPAVPHPHPGTVLTPGGFATMGFGPSAAIGAKLAAPTGPSSHWSATAAARTRRCWPLRSSRASASSGRHEQQRLRHHRRAAEGALRVDLRDDVPGRRRRPRARARLRRHRPGLRRHRRPDRLGCGFRPAWPSRRHGSAGRARRPHEEQPDAHHRALEHPRHLLARVQRRAAATD